LLLLTLALHTALPAWGAPASSPDTAGVFPTRQLAPGVYAVMGDTGRGSEGRANAGFIETRDGVIAIEAGGSPAEGERLIRTIRRITPLPIRWLVLTHHHPDHHFGAIAFRKAGAKVVAHADSRTLASEAGEEALRESWTAVVGRDAMRGFAFANRPDRRVEAADTLRHGGRQVVLLAPGPAHTAGDLLVWLPAERVLFAGDILIEDGVTMVVDGATPVLLQALDVIERLAPAVVVPGHGAIPTAPAPLVASTRSYIQALRADMRSAVERGLPMQRAMAALPPPDSLRPVSLNSRRRRNAVRAYLEAERELFGLGTDST
jgi:glyoxylase-like metal-dependent hydrolase (beta-lactamase superfamily II)